MIAGVHHVGLAARDPRAARRFLAGLAGARGADGELCRSVNLRFEFHRTEAAHRPHPALNQPGIRHVCVQSFHCDRLERAVVAGGGGLVAAPVDLGTGNLYAYARDPEGNLIEIEALPYAPPDQPSWIGHVALVTRDMATALHFYGTLLGTKAAGPRQVGPSTAVDTMGGMVGAVLDGAWLPAGNIALEFWQFRRPVYSGPAERRGFAEPGYSHLAFESDDPAADKARAIALGADDPGKGARPEITPGAADACFVVGPDGVLIEFVRMASDGDSIAGLADPAVVARIEAGRTKGS